MKNCRKCGQEFEDWEIRSDFLCLSCHMDESIEENVSSVKKEMTNEALRRKYSSSRQQNRTQPIVLSNKENHSQKNLATPKPSASEPLPPAPPQLTGTKICPFCAETIKLQAVVCRYCGRDLEDSQKPSFTHAQRSVNRVSVGDGVRIGAGLLIFLIVLFVVILIVSLIR